MPGHEGIHPIETPIFSSSFCSMNKLNEQKSISGPEWFMARVSRPFHNYGDIEIEFLLGCSATIFGISWDWMGSFLFAWTDQVRAKETDWSSETGIYLIKFDLKGLSQQTCLQMSERQQCYPNWSYSVLILGWTGVTVLYSTCLILTVTRKEY